MRKFILIGLCLCGCYAVQAQSTFNITFTNFPSTAAENAFTYAASTWGNYLSSPVPIKVNAVYYTFPGAPLGTTFGNGRKDFTGAPLAGVWYPTALANSLAGTELNPGETDMDIYINGANPFYFGTDGITPAGQYDFVTVMMHEMGHGLGFTSLAKKDTTTGSVGLLEQSDFAPVVTSFPWPDLDTLPGIYDVFTENTGGAPLLSFANPSAALGTQLTSNSIYFNGPYTLAATGGTRPRLYAPLSYALGSSILHLNEATYPTGHAEELMTPFAPSGISHHYVGQVTLAMLRDMGWNVISGLTEENHAAPVWNVWPNPAHAQVQLQGLPAGEKNIVITNASGQTVYRQNITAGELTLQTSGYANGLYTIRVENNTITSFRKLVVMH